MTTQVTKSISKSAKIRAILAVTPNATAKDIAKKARADVSLVYEVKSQLRKKASTGAKLPNIVRHYVRQSDASKPLFKTTAEVKSQVNTDTEIKYSEKFTKAVDLINEFKLNYNLGSAVAHALKSNSENKRANINAAIWYLKNELLTTNQ